MKVVVVGLNHKTAEVEIRERFSFSESQSMEALKRLITLEDMLECMLLSSCNRTEIYVVVENEKKALEEIIQFFGDLRGVEVDLYSSSLYCYCGRDAVNHIFKVAASLDSMIVGEPQILGQVKDAYSMATKVKTAGKWLHVLMHNAFRAAKEIRTHTGIAKNAVSVGFAGVELAKKIFDDLSEKTVIVIGAGEMGELTVKHLVSHGVKDILVANRTFSRAEELADKVNGVPIGFDELHGKLSKVDIIISSTGSREPIITEMHVKSIMRERRHKPMFFIDIAVPRDIDEAVGGIDNVYLYNIDDLQTVVEKNIQERLKEVKHAQAYIEQGIEDFFAWASVQNVVPLINSLMDKAEAVRKKELKKALNKLELSDREQEILNLLTSSLVKKILHTPITVLKSKVSNSHEDFPVELIYELFGLDMPHKLTEEPCDIDITDFHE